MEPDGPAHSLALRDGRSWVLRGCGPRARRVVARIAGIARLREAAGESAELLLVSERGEPAASRRGGAPRGLCSVRISAPGEGRLGWVCRLPAPGRLDEEGVLPLQVLNVPACFSVLGGGALIHAALLVHGGHGYLLAGPSGAGKTTASRRVPDPWRAPADELVLAVPDPAGRWWAHPWPTPGRVIVEGEGSWDVEAAVPVGGIFFLEQGARDEAAPVGRGRALGLLNDAAEEAGWPLAQGMAPEEVRDLRLRQFGNLARFAAAVPCFTLRATLTGEPWNEVLRAVAAEERTACAIG